MIAQVVEREHLHHRHQAGEGGMDLDRAHIGDDQQWRIFERRRIELELLEGGEQVLAGAFVFPGEATAPPDIGPAIAAAGLAGAFLEAEPIAVWVSLGGGRLVEQVAEIEEMLLRRGAFLERDVGPFADEGVRGHARWRFLFFALQSGQRCRLAISGAS
ncbi:MAG: hypothetical protein ACLFS2_08595 [Halochromatium sp.]|uniref:hypothetical protein n=1 Tax=Halochromatium sp. TaxID=2049430 RepID=UPI0039782045